MTPANIQRVRLVIQAAQWGVDAWRSTHVQGTTEAEASAKVESAILSQTGRAGIDTARAWAMVQSGPDTANTGRFSRSSGRRLE